MDSLAILGNAFGEVIAGGTRNLLPYAMAMAWGFAALGAMWMFLSIAFSQGSAPSMATRLVILSGFYIMVVQSMQQIGETLIVGAVDFGMIAGGMSTSGEAFLRSPDSIFTVGMANATDLLEMAEASCAHAMLGGCLAHFGTYVPLVTAGWLTLAVFAFIAIAVVLTFAMLKFTALSGLVLLPAIIFAPAAGFAQGIIRYAIHAAVQLMVLAMIVSVSTMVMGHMRVHQGPGLPTAIPFIVAALGLASATGMAMYIARQVTSGAMTNVGSMFAAPAMAVAATRSAAGHLDGPATAGARTVASEAYKSMSAAASARLPSCVMKKGHQN